jgi:hypothetical protein
VSTPLRLVGYWRNEQHPEYPDPAEHVDPSWDEDERSQVWWYLLGGTYGPAAMGFSTCRLCGRQNGSAEFSDDVFAWPEGLAHYVRDHSVRLPQDFVSHAVRRLQALEERGRETDWWLRQTQG